MHCPVHCGRPKKLIERTAEEKTTKKTQNLKQCSLDRLNKLCNDIDILQPNVKFEIFVVNKIHKLSANLDSPGNACRCRIQSDYGTKAKLRDFVQAFQIKIHLPQFLQQKKCQINTLSSGRWFLSSESCIRFDDEVVFALKLHSIH